MATDFHYEKAENVITFTKQYDASKELLFSMFSNPEQLEKWWGPTTWPATIINFDFTPGGKWHYYMQGPDGTKAYGLATFKEIDEPNTITLIDAFSDADANIDPNLPQGESTIRFVEESGMTTLTMTGKYDTVDQANEVIKMGMAEGMKDTWNQLERLVSVVD